MLFALVSSPDWHSIFGAVARNDGIASRRLPMGFAARGREARIRIMLLHPFSNDDSQIVVYNFREHHITPEPRDK
jgi:hypothetical protein